MWQSCVRERVVGGGEEEDEEEAAAGYRADKQEPYAIIVQIKSTSRCHP